MSCVSIAWSSPLCTLYQVLTSSLPPFQPCEISAFALWSLYSISRSKYCFQFSNYNMIAGFGHRVLSILGFFLESSKNISIFSGLECKNKYEIIFPWLDLIFTNMRAELFVLEVEVDLKKSQSIFCCWYWWQ